MANRYMKKCPTSLIFKEMQIRTRFHLIPVRITILKKKEISSVWEGMEKWEPLYTVDGNVNWCSHYGEQYGGFSKN